MSTEHDVDAFVAFLHDVFVEGPNSASVTEVSPACAAAAIISPPATPETRPALALSGDVDGPAPGDGDPHAGLRLACLEDGSMTGC